MQLSAIPCWRQWILERRVSPVKGKNGGKSWRRRMSPSRTGERRAFWAKATLPDNRNCRWGTNMQHTPKSQLIPLPPPHTRGTTPDGSLYCIPGNWTTAMAKVTPPHCVLKRDAGRWQSAQYNKKAALQAGVQKTAILNWQIITILRDLTWLMEEKRYP